MKSVGITRKEFLQGAAALAGFSALGGLPIFAAPSGWKPKKKPNLVFGILSDTHLMVDWDGKSLYRTMTFDYVRNAFKLFKERGIDAFVHLGDASHRGCVREWEFHKELFEKLFGKTGGPEFGKKAKLVVSLGRIDKIPSLCISIPMADGNPDVRPYAYNVVVVGDDPKVKFFKSEYFSGVNSGIGREPDHGITRVMVPLAELPASKKLTIAVRPVSSLGNKGKAIGATWRKT